MDVNSAHWRAFAATKAFDLLMAAPLIVWFGYTVVQLRPSLGFYARAILDDPADLRANLNFLSLLAAVTFNLLLIWLLLVRQGPVRKSRGLAPRLCALAGTFLGVGILHLKPAVLPLPWQIAGTALTLLGGAGSAIVVARLGKAFSIMPEARQLVTGGPYAYARHPLYAVEMLTIIGLAIQFQQPWAALLAAGVVLFQVIRSIFEEQVLAAAYPEYEAYRAKTARFIPFVL